MQEFTVGSERTRTTSITWDGDRWWIKQQGNVNVLTNAHMHDLFRKWHAVMNPEYMTLKGTSVQVPADQQLDIYAELDRLAWALMAEEGSDGHGPSAAVYESLPRIIRWAISRKCEVDPEVSKRMERYTPSLWLKERLSRAKAKGEHISDGVALILDKFKGRIIPGAEVRK